MQYLERHSLVYKSNVIFLFVSFIKVVMIRNYVYSVFQGKAFAGVCQVKKRCMLESCLCVLELVLAS